MEKSNKIERSEIWGKINKIVNTLPIDSMGMDAPDAPSVSTELEELFLKLLTKHNVSERCFAESDIIEVMKEVREKEEWYEKETAFCRKHNFNLEADSLYKISEQLRKVCSIIRRKFDLGFDV